MVCIRLCAKHDSNGNPRRVFVLLDSDGSIVRAIDEGYAGSRVLEGYSLSGAITDFETTPAEYRRFAARFRPIGPQPMTVGRRRPADPRAGVGPEGCDHGAAQPSRRRCPADDHGAGGPRGRADPRDRPAIGITRKILGFFAAFCRNILDIRRNGCKLRIEEGNAMKVCNVCGCEFDGRDGGEYLPRL